MNDWYQRMVATLQLNGKGEPTQKAYTRAVRMLSQFYDKTPDLRFGTRTPRVLPPPKKRQSLVAQDHAHLLLRHSLFLRQRSGARLAHSLDPARPERTPPARRLKRRRSPKHFGPRQNLPQPRLSLHRLLLRPTASRRPPSRSLRYRQSAHDDPCPPRQGRQGPLCPAASVDSSFAAPILAHSPPSPSSLPSSWPKGTDAKEALNPMAKSSVQGAFRRAKREAGVAKRASRSIPCAIPTPPISSKPASICASSNATWAMLSSKPPCSISTSPKRARKMPAS